MKKESESGNSLVLSYLSLRQSIGIIGIVLPFALVAVKIIIDGPGLADSISSYYYTSARDVFVGALCAMAVFLMSYHGYELIDSVASKLAAFFALGTAWLPTRPNVNASLTQIVISHLHMISALLLFLTLAFIALALFRKTNPNKPPTPQKQQRNIIYTICGVGMLVCIALAVSLKFIPQNSSIFALQPLFWLESVVIVLFGVSWFVKGEAILKDEVR